MDAFSYLSVLLSIILGLAITQVLQGYRALLLSRSRVTLYAPTLVWSGLLLVFATQSWWASFGLAHYSGWTFAIFAVVLLQFVILYMMAALVLPDFPAGEAVDLRAHYHRERRPFFALSFAMLVVSILKDVMLEGHLPVPENLAFHAMFGGAAIIAIATANERYHRWQGPVMIVLTLAYIALLFARL